MYLYQANQSKLLNYLCDREMIFLLFFTSFYVSCQDIFRPYSVSVNLSLLEGISFKHIHLRSKSILGISGNVIMCLFTSSHFSAFTPFAVCAISSINIAFMTQYTPHVLRHGKIEKGKLPYAIDVRSIGKYIFQLFLGRKNTAGPNYNGWR